MTPKHAIMTELKKKATTDKSDMNVKDLIWLLLDICLLTYGFIEIPMTVESSLRGKVMQAGQRQVFSWPCTRQQQ